MSKAPNPADRPHIGRSTWAPAIASAIAGALVGAFATLGTGVLTYWSHQNDLDTQMITLSIDILRAQPTQVTIPLREWAIDTIQKRANFNFTDDQKAVLIKEALPTTAHLASQIGAAVSGSIGALQPSGQ